MAMSEEKAEFKRLWEGRAASPDSAANPDAPVRHVFGDGGWDGTAGLSQRKRADCPNWGHPRGS